MNERKSQIIYYAVACALAVIFLASVICGATNGVHKSYSEAQTQLVIVGNCVGLFAVAVPFILNRAGLSIAKPIIYLWWAFALCHGLGETLVLYYRSHVFDKLLHCASGGLIFYTALALSRSILANKNVRYKFWLCLVFSVCAALTVALLWEICEFVCDSLFGTNAQKFIPLDEKFFNGGYSFEDLKGSPEDIAAFYKTPQGYKYALMDTMLDLVIFLAATIVAAISAILINLKRPYCFENAFYLKKK